MTGQIPIEHFVWLDEAAIDLSNQMILHAGKYSVLSALTLEGIIRADIIKGYIKKSTFSTLCNNL